MELVPDPCPLPVAQAPPAGHARTTAQLLGQHLSRDAALEHEEDAGEGGAIGDPRAPALGLERFRG